MSFSYSNLGRRHICVTYDLKIDSSSVSVLVWQRTQCGYSAGESYRFESDYRLFLGALALKILSSSFRWLFFFVLLRRQFKIMDRSISSKTILHLFMSCTLWCVVHAQHPDGMILLKQGAVIGVRIVAIICISFFFRSFCSFLCFSRSLSQCRFAFSMRAEINSNRNTDTCYIFKSHIYFSWKYFRKHQERQFIHTWEFRTLNRQRAICDSPWVYRSNHLIKHF